jgi:hypothetical protein
MKFDHFRDPYAIKAPYSGITKVWIYFIFLTAVYSLGPFLFLAKRSLTFFNLSR